MPSSSSSRSTPAPRWRSIGGLLCGFSNEGFFREAVEHAAAAHDHELVAGIASDHHLPVIRSGGARTLVRWAKMLPDEQLVEHPELAMAAATAVSLVGPRTVERRRFLQLAERARTAGSARFTPYVDAGIGMVRAFTFDEGVTASVAEARRAVEIAEREADDVLVASLAALAQAHYFNGDLAAASAAAGRALAHPEAERRPTAHAIARTTLALADVDRGLLRAARDHMEKARAMIGAIHSSRSWLGAVAYAASGRVHAAEGKLAEAERELVYAEPFFRDELSTVHHAWLLLLLARVRCHRGHLSEASEALHLARLELDELDDCGMLPRLASDCRVGARPGRVPRRAGRGAREAERGRARGAPAAGIRVVGSRHRRAAVPLGQHRSHAHPSDLQEARRELSRRGGGPSDRTGPAGRRVITQVICRSRSFGCGFAARCSRVLKSHANRDEGGDVASKDFWAGWVGFAGWLMIVIGSIDFFQGLIAIIRDKYYLLTPTRSSCST